MSSWIFLLYIVPQFVCNAHSFQMLGAWFSIENEDEQNENVSVVLISKFSIMHKLFSIENKSVESEKHNWV